MKNRNILLLILASIMLFSSCQKQPEDEIVEQSEPQRMAYRLSNASRVDDDIYFVMSVSSNTGISIVATEYGSENFETYVPCFDAVCDHNNFTQCCVTTAPWEMHTRQVAAFSYKGEPALVIFNPIDTCLSMPYSNVKTNLVCENFLYTDTPSAAYREWLQSASYTRRSELLVYKNHLYYVEIKNGVRTQYRISLEGGKPERVIEEDTVIIRTIINDRFYGIKYDVNAWTAEQNASPTRDQTHYFRSDMNYQNVEPLPESMEFFKLPGDDHFGARGKAILDADENFIYITGDNKVWKIPDSDINAEPIMLWDMEGKIPYEISADILKASFYNDGALYSVVNIGRYERKLLDSYGFPNPTQWYESSTLYSFDISTGECKTWDIKNQSYLIMEILYADDEYVYAIGRYVHDDNRAIYGVTMRLTLDTMRYEVILPDRFWEYSAETTAN